MSAGSQIQMAPQTTVNTGQPLHSQDSNMSTGNLWFSAKSAVNGDLWSVLWVFTIRRSTHGNITCTRKLLVRVELWKTAIRLTLWRHIIVYDAGSELWKCRFSSRVSWLFRATMHDYKSGANINHVGLLSSLSKSEFVAHDLLKILTNLS